MTHQHDTGYTGTFGTLCDDYPDAAVFPTKDFRTEWGPVFHRGRLGAYALAPFALGRYKLIADPAAHALADQFMIALNQAEAQIRSQNALGRIQYDVLLPSRVANSINV